MNMVLSFEESVMGTKKVSKNLCRSLNMRKNVFALLVMVKEASQELNRKNVEAVQELEHKL